jgi:exodeoxyribonuclease VII large subunit
MSQLSLFPSAPLTVSQINQYLRQVLESDILLQDVWVQGEISNLSRPASGHLYFTLKDNAAALRCVMWKNAALRLGLVLRDGMAIEVHGAVNIYEAAGQVQLYADTIRPAGEGYLFQEFLRLKARLEAEGLFDPQRKRPLPDFPHRIGIVTSPTGAALQDMLNVLRRRYPLAEVFLAPTPVQGVEAPLGIVAALAALNRSVHPDLILVARGGGSLEDLWAFNDERVARAIASSAAPVITGIGHETDFTIADFTADLRAPTPTAAAELATPNPVQDLRQALDEQVDRLVNALGGSLAARRWALAGQASQLNRQSPIHRISSSRQRLDDLDHRAHQALAHSLALRRAHLQGQQIHLASLGPQAVLQRGYAILTQTGPSGSIVVRSIHQVGPGDHLQAQVADGTFDVSVTQE